MPESVEEIQRIFYRNNLFNASQTHFYLGQPHPVIKLKVIFTQISFI